MSDSIFQTPGELVSGPYGMRNEPPTGGLSKRELFAAMAMQGLMIHKMIAMYDRNSGEPMGFAPPAADVAAHMAVRCADALIAALAKDGEAAP